MPKGIYQRKPRKRKQYPSDIVGRVADLYETGYTQAEIAAMVGLTQKVVWRLMVHHDIPRRPRVKRNQWGEKNHSWKGANAKYAALHLRVGALRGKPKLCEVCGQDSPSKKYEWASLNGRWDDPRDYKRMCISCHHKNDKTVRNLGAYALPRG